LRKLIAIVFILLSSNLFSQSSVESNAFTKILDNVFIKEQNPFNPGSNKDKWINKYLGEMKEDGSWTDIDYTRKDITTWTPIEHLKRLKTISLVYTNKNDTYFNNTKLYTALVLGLRYWYLQNPSSKNWWHNDINAPQHLGELLIILRKGAIALPKTLEDSLIGRMNRGNILKQTGANKMDVAIHYLYRAALNEDKLLMDTAVEQAFQPISFTHDEGLQYDYAFLQHGRQLQISSYGDVFKSGELKIAELLIGTNYALSGEKLKMLSTYYLNTYLRCMRGSYTDFNIEGRGISRVDILHKKFEINTLKMASLLDSTHATEWKDAIARVSGTQSPSYNLRPSHNHFYSADYTIHTQPDYSFNVRAVSVRTKRTESGNVENLIGKFLPDGSTNIQTRGDEYYNIMPIWDWNKIPGITSRAFNNDQPMDIFWGESGSTSFVGGVSDSSYGASCYEMNYNGIKAHKSWFFFDKEVVCLGAGIHCDAPENVTTTLNQCWLKGTVDIKSNNAKTTKAKENDLTLYNDVNWIMHDVVGYLFPEKKDVWVSTQTQTGDWYHINNSGPKTVITGDVCKLWIDHGTKPDNAGYAYIVVPGIKNNAPQTVSSVMSEVKIISNNDSLQIVYNEKLDVLEAIIYKPSTFLFNGNTIQIKQACVIMIREIGKLKQKIYISDPTQLLTKGSITLTNQKLHSNTEYDFQFPSGNTKGASLLISSNQ